MAVTVHIDTSGLNNMPAAVEELKRRIQNRLVEIAEIATEYAKEDSPWLTGNNRRSVTMDFYDENGDVTKSITEGDYHSDSSQEGNPGGLGFRIYTQSGYGGWLELGTKRMKPRPYIVTGFNKTLDRVESRLNGIADSHD